MGPSNSWSISFSVNILQLGGPQNILVQGAILLRVQGFVFGQYIYLKKESFLHNRIVMWAFLANCWIW